MNHSTFTSTTKGFTMLTSTAARRFAIATAAVIGLAGGSLAVHADTLSQRVLANTIQNLPATPAGPTGGFPKIPLTCAAGASPCNVDLTAGTGQVTVHDSVNGSQNIPFWGFGVNGQAVGLAGTPGSIIKVTQGTTVTINLTQAAGTGAAIDLMFPNLPATAVSKSGTTYTVQASKLGTMLFEPGLDKDAPKQIDMGLVGVLVVVPSTCADTTNYACAYDNTTFDDEAVVAFNTVDADFASNPTGFDMSYFGQARSADGSARRVYHLINGKSFPDTDQIDAIVNDKVLLRYVNAGEAEVVPNLVGIAQTVVGMNASANADPKRTVAPLIMAGETVEASIAVPGTAVTGQNYALTNQVRDFSHGNSHGFSGALTFLSVWTR